MVLQALEGLSDREAVSALRRDIAWKVACGPRQGRRGVPSRRAGVLARPAAGLLHPHQDELRAARRRATTRSFQESYRRWRPMVERSIAWLVADGCRRVPCRGIARNHLWWSVRVAAVNLRRLLILGLARHDRAWVVA